MKRPVYRSTDKNFENSMLNWVIIFFLLAVAAAVLGFGGLVGRFNEIAQFMAIIFVVLYIMALVYSAFMGRSSRNPPMP